MPVNSCQTFLEENEPEIYGIFTASLSFSMSEDAQDFEKLVARHWKWVFHTCKRFLKSEDLARDATQEVFARCFEKMHTMEGSNLPGWLKAIAVNTCLNIIEKEKRWTALEHEDEIPDEGTVETELIRGEQAERARRGIEQLPENQKLVFCMRYIDGCSYQEIQELTGFSPKQVKTFLQNARRNFELWWRAKEGASWKRI